MKNDMFTEKGIGGTLLVENVQTLASNKDLKDIPTRYIRPELEFDVVNTDESREIPVIDLSRLLDQQFMNEELTKFHSACEDWGFFQLINHGMPEEVFEKMKVDVKDFFKLPLEEKKADCPQLFNYSEGYGQAFVMSEEQKLDWGDMLYLRAQPVAVRNMTIWPKNPTSFRETLDKYSSETKRMAICLLGFMAKNLSVDPNKLTSMLEMGGIVGMRMNYYPPCVVNAEKVLGISPHSDATILTLLTQVNEVQGLQIRKNGIWVPVKSIPGAFIVNIGDLIEVISNGKYKSIEHRVVVNPLKERMSIAAFQTPVPETTIGPLPEVLKVTGGKEKYKTLQYIEYLKFFSTVKLDQKCNLDFLKLDN